MNNLYHIIKKCKNKSSEEILIIINMFDPLINKYVRLLNFDDAKSELITTLIETLFKIPIHKSNFNQNKYIISYIKKSIFHKYISISKKISYESKYESEFDFNLIESNKSTDLEFYDLINDLTPKEKTILISKFIKNMKDTEIAQALNISRQAVNQTKNRALIKLKKVI